MKYVGFAAEHSSAAGMLQVVQAYAPILDEKILRSVLFVERRHCAPWNKIMEQTREPFCVILQFLYPVCGTQHTRSIHIHSNRKESSIKFLHFNSFRSLLSCHLYDFVYPQTDKNGAFDHTILCNLGLDFLLSASSNSLYAEF
ncbi:hypothetical protein AVEN_58319-1 [Araneus ventricosus]|uniref:Uncharacterized protein n=1 Tax=Araneus ventricosus TaxID=182803 RepID=A0A4Y2CS37_ARAVE|nr:hypothetical protein AVEN_58319-1 [Araneus ventricosus]